MVTPTTPTSTASPDLLVVLRDLSIAAVGAFIAYYGWSHFQTPVLSIRDIKLYEGLQEDNRRGFFRVSVENIGKQPARDCEARLWLRGLNDGGDKMAIIDFPTGWVSKAGEVFTDTAYLHRRADIGSKSIGIVQIFRRSWEPAKLYAGFLPGDIGKMIAIIENDKVDSGSLDDVGDTLLIHGGDIQQARYIEFEDIADIEWNEAELQITSTNAAPTSRKLRFELDDDSLSIELFDRTSLRGRLLEIWYAIRRRV